MSDLVTRACEHLARAIERTAHAIDSGDRDVASGSAAEASMWVAALDSTLTKQLGNSNYYERRDADHDGRVIGGLVYVRNLLGHQLAEQIDRGWQPVVSPDGDAVVIIEADETTTPVGVHGGTLVWLPFWELPPPDEPERNLRDETY
jgi:hypothetical protein